MYPGGSTLHSQESELEKTIEDRILSAKCFICDERISGNLAKHIVTNHGENELTRAILKLKRAGHSDVSIKNNIGVSFQKLQDIFTNNYGKNIQVIKQRKRISHMQPRNFELETTTVWSFKNRGSWCTHNGSFRGNWSPYVPRNLILRYTKPGDTVLDCFVGGGTTAVESKILGRKCIAIDINPGAIGITKQNLDFPLLVAESNGKSVPAYEPELTIGDARNLKNIESGSIDLICTHPPYADIIEYSPGIDGDLSHCPVDDFVKQMKEVSKELHRVLKPHGKCAVLIGDSRKSKHVVPIGFNTIQQFLDTGFSIKELIIKRQHNCKTTGFWYKRSIEYNFLLLAHEYLPVFEKGGSSFKTETIALSKHDPSKDLPIARSVHTNRKKEIEMETSSVWIFPKEHSYERIRSNLSQRFLGGRSKFVEIVYSSSGEKPKAVDYDNCALAYIRPRNLPFTEKVADSFIANCKDITTSVSGSMKEDTYIIVEAQDSNFDSYFYPFAFRMWQNFQTIDELDLKEIVIVEQRNKDQQNRESHLNRTHLYLLVYRRKD